MADNSSLPVASGNETFANEDIAGVKYPTPKVTWGPTGTSNRVDVAANKMLPTQLRHSDGTIVTDATGMKISASQLGSLGQTTMAQSVPVAFASNQSTLTSQLASGANLVSGVISTAMTGTTSTSLIAAPGASLRNYITQITVSNSHATVGTDVIIQDGSGGTTLYVIPAAAVYGGAVITFPAPLRQPTTNTAIFCANVTTGASTKVSASGFKGA